LKLYDSWNRGEIDFDELVDEDDERQCRELLVSGLRLKQPCQLSLSLGAPRPLQFDQAHGAALFRKRQPAVVRGFPAAVRDRLVLTIRRASSYAPLQPACAMNQKSGSLPIWLAIGIEPGTST
jgi:hypothetical protein